MSYQSKHTGSAIDASVDTTQQILNIIYPIGAVYISVNDVSPANFIGGTWERIQDRFLLAAGSSYGAGTTGGTASHTHTSAAHTHTTAGHILTINEIPSHNHTTQSLGTVSSSDAASNQSNWCALRSVTLSDVLPNLIGYTNSTGGGTSHSHGDTGSTTPGSTGSTSNLPPYLSVYMWKRTA